MIHDQADELRRWVRERTMQSHGNAEVPLVVVGGGSSCVGSTTLAVNLGLAVARLGHRVILVDADLRHGGNLLGCEHRDGGSIAEVLAGRRSIHEVLFRGPLGVQIVPGRRIDSTAREWSAFAQDRFLDQLLQLGPYADVVIMDVGNGQGTFERRFWQAANRVCVVTTPSDAAVMHCYEVIKLLTAAKSGQAVYACVNQAEAKNTADEILERLDKTCQHFLGLSLKGKWAVPVGESASRGTQTFFPESPEALSIERVAAHVMEDILRENNKVLSKQAGDSMTRAS